jgi:hypothetical protein
MMTTDGAIRFTTAARLGIAEPSQCGLKNPCLTLLGQHQRRGIGARTLAPTPGKELEPLPCAARPELNTIAEAAVASVA